MSDYAWQPARMETAIAEWRALDRCVYRYVLAQGGSTLLAEVAAWCSLADGLGHSALPLFDATAVPGFRALTADEVQALRAQRLVGDGSVPSAFVIHGSRFYLWRGFAAERAVAAALVARMLAAPSAIAVEAALLDVLFAESDPVAVAQQRLAVQRVVAQQLLVVTGAPGSGKTSTVLRMLLALIATRGGRGIDIRVAAPTGRAAQRLLQSLRQGMATLRATPSTPLRSLLDSLPEIEASTLHRLLGYRVGGIARHEGARQPLAADVVVVDEASMLDLNLLRVLLQSLRADATLILLGDADQLTSVEAGSALADVVASMAALRSPQLVRLDHIFRASSALQPLLAAARAGDLAGFEQGRAQAGSAFAVLPTESAAALRQRIRPWAAQIAQELREVIGEAATADSAARALRRLASRQLLCALRDGDFGARAIARAIERGLRVELGVTFDSEWFAGRGVIVTENDYVHGLFNGDIGIALADADGVLQVWFESEADATGSTMRALPPHLLPQHESAGAITIHKAQGSEYAQVAVVLPPNAEHRILSRQLLYTALSRAKHGVEVWASEATLAAALMRPIRREGGLVDAIIAAADVQPTHFPTSNESVDR